MRYRCLARDSGSWQKAGQEACCWDPHSLCLPEAQAVIAVDSDVNAAEPWRSSQMHVLQELSLLLCLRGAIHLQSISKALWTGECSLLSSSSLKNLPSRHFDKR